MLLHILIGAALNMMTPNAPAPCSSPYVPAKIVNPVLPNIPQQSLDTGMKHATVLLRVSLDERGRPHDVELQRSSGYVDVDTAADGLAEHSRYDPEVRGCAPTSGSYTLKVDFEVTRKDPKTGGGVDLGVILAHAAVLPALKVPGNAKNTKEGTAAILVSVDPSGKVTGTTVESSTGLPELDRAAVTLAQNGDYLPALYGCKSVSGTYQYVVIFRRS